MNLSIEVSLMKTIWTFFLSKLGCYLKVKLKLNNTDLKKKSQKFKWILGFTLGS